jgi:hypothetical protein
MRLYLAMAISALARLPYPVSLLATQSTDPGGLANDPDTTLAAASI